MLIFFIVLFITSLFFESTLTTIPLTLVCLICFTVIKKDTSVFLPGFLAGIVIDMFRMEQIGSTSIFYLCYLLFILLYKKKYEIYSLPFVMIATFFGSYLFLLIFHFEGIFLQSLLASLLAVILFAGLRYVLELKERRHATKFLPLS